MRFLIFLSFFTIVSAHVPIFPDFDGNTPDVWNAFEIKNIDKKSWGVYGTLKDPIWLKMDAKKGERMSISLQRNKLEANYDVGIFGPGLNSVNCTKDWYGWTHSSDGGFFTRDINDLSEFIREKVTAYGNADYPELLEPPIVVHGDGNEPAEYEPFGVNLYWSVGGCNATWPATATYYLVVTAPPDTSIEDASKISYSLGVGMVEAFAIDEILIMPYLILETFSWSHTASIVIPVYIIVFLGVFILRWTTFTPYSSLDSRGSIVLVGTYLVWIGASAYVASGAGFLAQLIWCYAMGDEGTSYTSVVLSVIVHIILPIVVGISVLYFFGVDQRRNVVGGLVVIVAGIYGLGLVWLGFTVFPSLVVVGGALHLLIP